MKFYYIFFSFIITIINSKPLKIPFKTRFDINNMNKDNVMQMLINNNIFTQISFGSNNQIIEMDIKLQKDSTYILSNSCPENIFSKKFNEKQSETYELLTESKTYYMYEFKDATYSKDNIMLLLANNKNIKINNFKFMLVNSLWNDNQKYMSGMLGLILSNRDDIPEDTDFIIQLKSNNIIDSYVFMLDYKDNYNGVLYLGNYFHDFNKNYSLNDFKITEAGNPNYKIKSWEINIEKIMTNNYIIQNNTYINCLYEIGVIASPDDYHNYIKENFFKNYLNNGACHEQLNLENIAIFNKYDYIVCDKNNFIKETFPDLYFYNREMNMNFSLNYKDLFYEFENKIYFLVVFPRYPIIVKHWYIGKPFFIKYKLFFDKDKKTIGLYNNFTNENNDDDDEKNPIIILRYKSSTIYIVIIIFLIIVLIGLLYFFLIKKKSGKLKANELEAKFTYIPISEENKRKII